MLLCVTIAFFGDFQQHPPGFIEPVSLAVQPIEQVGLTGAGTTPNAPPITTPIPTIQDHLHQNVPLETHNHFELEHHDQNGHHHHHDGGHQEHEQHEVHHHNEHHSQADHHGPPHQHNDHQHGPLSLDHPLRPPQVPPVDPIPIVTSPRPTETTAGHDHHHDHHQHDHHQHDHHQHDHHQHDHHHHKKEEEEVILGPDIKISPRGHSRPVIISQIPVKSFQSSNHLIEEPMPEAPVAASLAVLDAVPATLIKKEIQPRSDTFFFDHQPTDLSASDSEVSEQLAFNSQRLQTREQRRSNFFFNADSSKDVLPEVSNSVDDKTKSDRRIEEVKELVDCGGSDLGFCDMNSRYPG